MRLVGLTGGIASGKSTVSSLFVSAGVHVVDADIVARNVVQKGIGGWKKIVKAFGNDILLENGEIDRARLGQIVFGDPVKRKLLNRLQFLSKGEKIWVVCGSAITLLLFRNAGLKHICEDGKSSYSLVPWFLTRKSQTCTPWFLGFGAKIPQGFISTVSN